MINLLSTSEIIKKYQLNANKKLGQNFILDKNFTDKIARSSGDLSGKNILEVGPGPGSLSRSILDLKPQKLTAIEMDQRCVLALGELKNFYGENFEIINDDALKIDEQKIYPTPFKIIANLPYNIATVLIFKWLKILPQIESMYLMVQKEVAQRITAKIGDNHYGRLSIMINLLCDSKIVFLVNKSVFVPAPKVESAVISIVPNPQKMQKFFDEIFLENFSFVVATAFNQRRKMLKSSLKNCFRKYNFNDKDGENLLTNLNISANFRAEQITIEQFVDITNNLMQK